MENKPKILILSLAYSPFIGGAEIAVQEITKRLADNFEFDLICARMDRKLAKKEKNWNVNVYRIGFGFKNLDKYIFTFFGFFKAWSLYQKKHYQIIWPIMAAYSSFAVLFKIFTKAKIVLTLQEGDPLEYITGLKRFKIFRPIYSLYFKKIDKVQVISSFLANWAKNLGVKEEKIVVVPNGVFFELNPYKIESAKGSEDEDIFNKYKIIITASRLVEKNGIADLIKAMFYIKDQNIKLLIMGDGPLDNELKNLAMDLRLIKNKEIINYEGDKIYFWDKISNHPLVGYYLNKAKIFVRPSLSEGLGNAFLEAMFVRLPVIATPVGGIPDFLTDGATGWFCQPRNPRDIAEKIAYVLDEKNKSEVEQVVANARKMVEEKYDWNIIAEKMKEVFNKLI